MKSLPHSRTPAVDYCRELFDVKLNFKNRLTIFTAWFPSRERKIVKYYMHILMHQPKNYIWKRQTRSARNLLKKSLLRNVNQRIFQLITIISSSLDFRARCGFFVMSFRSCRHINFVITLTSQ